MMHDRDAIRRHAHIELHRVDTQRERMLERRDRVLRTYRRRAAMPDHERRTWLVNQGHDPCTQMVKCDTGRLA